MESWFIPAISATFVYGTLNFLYKAAAERGLDSDRVVNTVGASVAALSLLTLFATQKENTLSVFTRGVFLYAFCNGLFFGLGALSKFAALRHAPAGTVFPLNRLNNLMVMLVGFLFFRDRPSMMQAAGLVLTIFVIALVSLDRPDESGRPFPHKKRGMIYALLSASCTAASTTVGKLLAGTSENRLAYICCSYFLVFLITTALSAARGKNLAPKSHPKWKSTLVFGLLIGGLNYGGYFLVLKGFGLGPISLVQAIMSMSMVIPIALSCLFYGERLSPANKAAIALAAVSAALISIR